MTAQPTAPDAVNVEGREDHQGAGSVQSLPSSTVTAPADALAEAFAVVVTTERGARRRLYLSLHSASRARERARERGDDVELVLVRLVPVEGVL